MKLSVLPVSLFGQLTSGQMSISDWAKKAQEFGADGFDISTMFYKNHTATYIQGELDTMKANGTDIQPVMVCCYPDFTNPDKMERERELQYLNRDIALSSKFGFQYMRITAGQNHPGLELDSASTQVAEYFARAAETAEKFGIRLVFENHSKPGAWPLIDYSFQQEAFLAIYEKIKDVNVGINFDTANAVACGADPAKLLETVIDKVWTVHLNETSTVGKWSPALLGTGLVDLDTTFSILAKHNFDGWVCLEEASGGGLQGIQDAIAVARKYIPSGR